MRHDHRRPDQQKRAAVDRLVAEGDEDSLWEALTRDAGRTDARVALGRILVADGRDAQARLDLGNLYFDSERFEDAARWYEQAIAIDPRNVGASTDLGISYYYMN